MVCVAAGVKRRTPNAECRMHCLLFFLLSVSFTCVCLQLAFICWKGPTTIKCCPFQQIKANRKQTQVKLTASKQCIWRSAFGVLPLPSVMGNKPPKRKRSIWVGVSDQSNQYKRHRQCKESFTETGSKYLWRSQSVGKRLRVYKVMNGLLVTASFSLIKGGGGRCFIISLAP